MMLKSQWDSATCHKTTIVKDELSLLFSGTKVDKKDNGDLTKGLL